MRRILASSIVVLSAFGNSAFAQQSPATPVVNDADKPRVFITDSTSWSTHGSAGGSNRSVVGSSARAAKPKTAGLIKTFGHPCAQEVSQHTTDATNHMAQLR